MKPIVVASLLAPFIVIGAMRVPASAEPLRPIVTGLPPFEIVAILRADGFEPLARPVRGAGVFFVRALDPHDNDVRLTVDARTGRIMAVRSMTIAAPVYAPPIVRGYPATAAYRHSFDDAAGFEDATGALPVPPRAVPGGPVGRKSTLPLPRPRPSRAMAATPAALPPSSAVPKPADAVPADKPVTAPSGGVELPPVTPLE